MTQCNIFHAEKDVEKMKAFYQQGYDAVAGRIDEIRAYFADEKAKLLKLKREQQNRNIEQQSRNTKQTDEAEKNGETTPNRL